MENNKNPDEAVREWLEIENEGKINKDIES